MGTKYGIEIHCPRCGATLAERREGGRLVTRGRAVIRPDAVTLTCGVCAHQRSEKLETTPARRERRVAIHSGGW